MLSYHEPSDESGDQKGDITTYLKVPKALPYLSIPAASAAASGEENMGGHKNQIYHATVAYPNKLLINEQRVG